MITNLPQREEYLRRKRRRRIFKIIVLLLSIALFVGLLSYVSHRKEIRISDVELSGGVLVTQKDVESKTLSYLSGSYFWIFPKNNSFLYKRKALEKYLAAEFQRIDTINIQLNGFHTLSVDIKERKPVAIWCDTLPSRQTFSTTTVHNADGLENKCFFIDQNSTIFAKSPIFSGDAYFKYYGLISEGSPIGQAYIASTTEFAEISSFVDKSRSLGLRPQYIVAKENNDFSLFISGGGEIIFDTKEPLSQIASNLETLLGTPALAKITNIDYIDLRYGNKLFYKLK